MNNKFEPSKKITTKDGTEMHLWESKLHNWEGPALIPEGNKKKREYYIHGIKFTEDAWKEARKNRSGLPFYKQSSGKGSTNRF